MTIESMIRSHDESALEAHTSKGLLRRAKRVIAEDPGQVETVDNHKAEVHAYFCVTKALQPLNERSRRKRPIQWQRSVHLKTKR